MNNKKNLSTIEYLIILLSYSIISFLIFIILLHTALFKNINVYMYRGIILLFISAILGLIILVMLDKYVFNKVCIKDYVTLMLVYLSCAMMFFTLVPVTVERAVSVHMLFSIEEKNGMTKNDIQDNFINDYVIKNDAFQKRIVEQEVTGSIELNKNDDKYYLTNRGKFIVALFRLTAKIFNADIKLMK